MQRLRWLASKPGAGREAQPNGSERVWPVAGSVGWWASRGGVGCRRVAVAGIAFGANRRLVGVPQSAAEIGPVRLRLVVSAVKSEALWLASEWAPP